ncbi:inactive serine/threonine-protein kinase PLK5 isoform X2 [Carettochelys insculpta]|uniref:inactive serine/threonine-protein kinase PLK5 isoform X2 n=1 Tax=Carettochelys insculpta TaxID=44489 RepID=UPI003EBCB5DD
MGRMEQPTSRRAQGPSLSYFVEDPGTGTLYRRGQLLGKGAFGRCYKFTDTSTGKVYAVKVVSLSRVARLDGRGKVEREIELHRHLCHPHVVGFHRHFADQDNIYMILEYCSCKSLAHVLKARKRLTEPEVRYYLRQIIAGLRYLHQRGIIHRDLKLSNFFLTKNMQVKVGDLGLATREERAGRRRGVVCGTPNYLAPEVIAKKGHCFQSDVWALGCIMYTALTGCSPFELTHKQEMYQCIREGRYPVPPILSPSARELIGRLLAPSPAERPSLDEVLQHEFFTQGFTPDKLPSRACHSVPIFTLPNPLSKLLQKAAKVLFRGSPCQEPRAESPVSGQERVSPSRQAGNWPAVEQSSEVGGDAHPSSAPTPPLSPSSCQAERGSAQDAPLPQAPSPSSVHLLMSRALRPSRSGASGWSVVSAVESVTRVLSRCLENMPLAEHNPQPCPAPPGPWVTRWVDYSNKYGFGYLLSDGCTGTLLADGTHLALCPWPPRICYCPAAGEAMSFPQGQVPAALAPKLGTLHFFAQYMQQKLLEDEPGGPSSPPDAPCLLCCAKSDRALLMLFSNGTLQVNFYHDRTKLVLSCPGGGHLLTLIDRQRVSATFPLGALAAGGCTPALRECLQYALSMAHCL